MTRTAISPRLATRTLVNIGAGLYRRASPAPQSSGLAERSAQDILRSLGSERGPREQAPLVRRTVWAAASPFNWTLGAAVVFPAAAPASAQCFSICITPYALACGQV